MENMHITPPLAKILFVDQPFMEGDSLRNKRSRFLWEILCKTYDADLLLLKTTAYLEKPVPNHSGFDKLYSLTLGSPNQLYPDSYHILAAGQAERFACILDSKRFELIVFAGLSCLPLVHICEKILPNCKIIIDIEHNFLPELEGEWKNKKSLEALPKLWSYTRQRVWDRFLLKSGTYCFFANSTDALSMQQKHKLKADSTLQFPLPIDFTEATNEQSHAETSYLLFWGNPDNPANLEAGKTLLSDIYPRISKQLVEKNIRIMISGPAELKDLCAGRIQYLDLSPEPPVANPNEESILQNPQHDKLSTIIANALFIILPLSAPDTEERVLCSAAAKKAVVCTTQAVEGMQFPENCLLTADQADALAGKIIRLLQYPKEIDVVAQALHQYSLAKYNREAICATILAQIQLWMATDDQK